jgi:hypothetical protein
LTHHARTTVGDSIRNQEIRNVNEKNGMHDIKRDSKIADRTQIKHLPVGGMEAGGVADAGSKQ